MIMESKEKIKSSEELERIVSDLKTRKKKIVWTNGCFDILHIGHIYLLEKAKSFGDVLVVGLNTDNSIKRLKGNGRPVVLEKERSIIISALESVNYVTLFDEDNPCDIISLLKPDIHVKGGDYNPEDYEKMPETKVIREYGGEIKIVGLLKGYSTTNIINKLNGK